MNGMSAPIESNPHEVCEACGGERNADPDFCDACLAKMTAARAAVTLATLKPGDRFTVATGYLAPGGSSDAGVLTVEGYSQGWGRIATTDGRALIGATRVHREST